MKTKIILTLLILSVVQVFAGSKHTHIKQALDQAKNNAEAYRADSFGQHLSIIRKPNTSEWIYININLDKTTQTITLKMKKRGSDEIKETGRNREIYESYFQIFNDIAKREHEEKVKAQQKIIDERNRKLKEIEAKRQAESERVRKQQEKLLQEQREYREKREAERIAKEKQEESRKEAYNDEIIRIDDACKKAGYKGLAKYQDTPIDMVTLIYLTQRDGGLEKYLNTVVGNLKNDKDSLSEIYRKVKAFQVLDDGVLYTYSEYDSTGSFSFTVHVEKEIGKLYQEGQSLEDTFHAFKGMYTYVTTSGAKKKIPSFSKVKLK